MSFTWKGLVLGVSTCGVLGSTVCDAQGVNLNVPGPNYAEAAKAYAQNQAQPKHRPMVFMPAQTEGYNVHGGVSTGVMAGSHHTSGEYTAGWVTVSRGNTYFSFGATQMHMTGHRYNRYDPDGGPYSIGPYGYGPGNTTGYSLAIGTGP